MSIVVMAAPVPGTYADIAHAVWTVTRAARTTIGLSLLHCMAQAPFGLGKVHINHITQCMSFGISRSRFV